MSAPTHVQDAIDEELASEENAGYELTQLGNAKRFADTFLGKLTFIPEVGKWYYWDNNIWKCGADGREYGPSGHCTRLSWR